MLRSGIGALFLIIGIILYFISCVLIIFFLRKHNPMRAWWSAYLLYVSYSLSVYTPIHRLVTKLYVTYFSGTHTPIVAIPDVDAMLYVTHIPDVYTPLLEDACQEVMLYVAHIPDVHTPSPM